MDVMHYLRNRFKTNKILGYPTKDNKKNCYPKLDARSLLNVRIYCYGNTCYTYCGTNRCYYCIVIDLIHAEFQLR